MSKIDTEATFVYGGLILIIFLTIASIVFGNEVDECNRLAPKYNGKLEVVQWDASRVDILNDEYAIEADWSHKWAEAVGQSLYYSILTGKKPGIILLVKDKKKEMKHIYRCQTVCAKYGIKLFLEQVDE